MCRIKVQGFLSCYSRKVAKTDLYNERKREGRKEEGEIEKAACSAVSGSVLSAAVFIVTRLYPLNKKTRMLLNMQ